MTTGALAAGRRLPRFKLTFFEALTSAALTSQSSAVDLNPDVESCSFTTQWDQGFSALGAGYDKLYHFPNELEPRRFGRLAQPVDMRGFAHVVLSEGKNVVAEGRVQLPHLPGGRVQGFTAQGYGVGAMKDGIYRSSDAGTSWTSGTLLAHAIRAAAPTLRVDTATRWVDPGVLHVPAEFNLKSPDDIKGQVVKEGDVAGHQLMFLVYENRVAQLRTVVAPASPNYLLDWDESVDYEDNYDETYGSLILDYTGGSASPLYLPSAALHSPAFVARYGFDRVAYVSGGSLSDAAALAFGNTWLAQHFNPTVSCRVTLGGAVYGSVEGLRLPSGGTRAPWLVRAGQWVQLGASENGTTRILPIVRTSFDCNSLQLSLELGQPAIGWELTLANLRATAAYYTRGINPTTGAPN